MIKPLLEKFYFKRRDVRAVLGVSDYRIRAFIADGILDAPIKEKGRASFWTRRQVLAAIKRLDERENPKPVSISRPRRSKPLSLRHNEQLRRNAA